MSKTKDEATEGARKKGGGLVVKLVLALVLLAAGGGGVFGLMAAGVLGGGEAAKEDNAPKLVRKGEEDPYAPPPAKGDDGAEYVFGEDGSEYRTAYFEFDGEFTSNLRGSEAMVQMALAVSTQRDGRVMMWLNKHELAVRSRLLIDLSDTDAQEFATPEGKARLQQRMADSINAVLTEMEGFGGVDRVYFRSLIVQ